MPRSSFTVTSAALYEYPDGRLLDIVTIHPPSTMAPGDTFAVEDTVHGQFHSLFDDKGHAMMERPDRIKMFRYNQAPPPRYLPDRSDPQAVEQWLASDEAPEP